jgi:signal transduction histidine kinase
VDAAIYRLAQEALTNAVRHARNATRVEIAVRRVGDVVRLRVDRRRPTSPGPRAEPGFGLTGMAERAQLLGGSLSAGPGPEGGWVVEAVLPAGGPA